MSRLPALRRPLPVGALLVAAITGCGASPDGPHVATLRTVPPGSPWTTVALPARTADEASTVVAEADGTTLVADAVGVRGSTATLLPVAADGRLGPVRRVPGLLAVAGWGDRAVLLRGTSDGRRVGVSSGPLDARTPGPETVLHRGGASTPLLAAGPEGDVLVAISDGGPSLDAGYAGTRIALHWTGPGRDWAGLALPGRQQLLASAVDARGVATLLLERTGAVPRSSATGRATGGPPHLVTSRTLDLRSGRLGPERTLARSTPDLVDGSIASNARGDAVLAWGAQDGGEEADQKYVVRVALRFGDRFTTTRTLDASGDRERPGVGPVTAMDDAGGATVAWTQAYDTADFDVRVVPRIATASGPGRFGPHRDLLRSGRVGAAAASGTTTLVALTGSRGRHVVTRDGYPAKSDVGGVVVRSGGLAVGPLEPVGRASVVGGPEVGLTGGPAGLRAVWDHRVARRSP